MSYSTCSVYKEEDEDVGRDVLRIHGDKWRLVEEPKAILEKAFKLKKDSTAKDRSEEFLVGAHCSEYGIRFCHACSKGLFSGFFCALFKRK